MEFALERIHARVWVNSSIVSCTTASYIIVSAGQFFIIFNTLDLKFERLKASVAGNIFVRNG
jgi:hypothetical protein